MPLRQAQTNEFRDGAFESISGFGIISAVIVFSENPNGKLSFVDYTEPADGETNEQSTKKLFPEALWRWVLEPGCRATSTNLLEQEKLQAKAYLKSIGRN